MNRLPFFQRSTLVLAILVASLAGCSRPKALHEGDWLIVPGERVGPITRDTTEQDLKKIFGTENVRTCQLVIPDSEGTVTTGTLVFTDNPTKALEIFWIDPAARKILEMVVVELFPQVYPSEFGDLSPAEYLQKIEDRGFVKSLWRTSNGISVGIPMTELERLNGKPFGIGGFDADYEGYIANWQGGALQKKLKEHGVHLCLYGSFFLEGFSKKEVEAISGLYNTILSSHPVMQKFNPLVEHVVITFRSEKEQ